MPGTSAPHLTHRPGSLRPAGWSALLIALAISSCTGPAPAARPPVTVTIGTAFPSARDATSGLSSIVDMLTLEGPVAIGWDGVPGPRGIDKWSWSADGLTLRLHLQRGLRFHDGTMLTNQLAAVALGKALTPGANGVVSSTIKSVTAEGSEDIVIRTGQPEGFLLSDISMANFAMAGQPHIGTGPFLLVSDQPPITLRAFDGYRTGRPAIAEVKITEYGSQRQAWAAMMRGEANVLHTVSGESLDFVKAESTVQTHSFLRAYYHALLFNLRLPRFAPKDLRRALNSAVDRQAVVDLGLGKQGIPADGPIWPFHFAHPTNQPIYRFDPALATRLLDGIGLTAGREHQPGRMPSRFRFTCLVPSEDQLLQRVALIVQKQLYNVAVDMQVELTPFRELRRRVVAGEFEAALTEAVSTRSLSFVYTLWHSPEPGTTGPFNSPYTAADAPLDRLRAAITEPEVRAAVADVQRAFYEDPPAVFLNWMRSARALGRNIEVPDEPDRDVLGNIARWRPAAGAVR
jgi:ABC-type transport system substrate-binding protein